MKTSSSIGRHTSYFSTFDSIRFKKILHALSFSGVSAVALSASSAFAQSGQAATAADNASGEIVVTAQKREEKLRDIPFSISAVSGDAIAKRGIKDVVDLANAVPALGAYPVTPGQNLLSIRGISGFRGDSALVGTYLDEIPLSGGVRLGDGAGLPVQALDLARVEVLKGPQGTLFGEGAIGGVVRYITNDPDLGRVGANVRAAYFDTRDGDGSGEFSAMLNVPVVEDVLGLRIAGTYQKHGGWINNVSTGKANYNDDEIVEVRAKLLFKPTDRLSINGLVNIHRMNFDGQNTVSILPYKKSLFQQSVIPDYPTNGYTDFDLFNITANYDLGFASLMSSTSYFNQRVFSSLGWVSQIIPGKGEVFGGGWEFLIPPSPGVQRNFSQELRLTSSGNDRFKWVIGASYKHTDNKKLSSGTSISSYVQVSDDPLIVSIGNVGGTHGKTTSKAVALFADGSYELLDGFELGGGIRYFREQRDYIDYSIDDVLLQDVGGTFKKNTYRIFAKYKINNNINLYANMATGFRSGGFNSATSISFGSPLDYNPESSIFYEAGVKTSFIGGRATFDISYYNGKYKDQLQTIFSFAPSGEGFGYTANSGTATIKGVEWALSVSPIQDLRLGFNGNIPRTKYTKTSPAAPVAVGDPIDFVPRYEYMVNAEYSFDLTPDIHGFVNIDSTWKGHQQNTNRDSGIGYVFNVGPKLNFINASVGAEFQGFRVTIFGKNLADERGILSPQFSGLRPQARPRQIGISLEKTF